MADIHSPPLLGDVLPSHVPGICWPPIPDTRQTASLALLYQLESSQWLSAAALHARQSIQLKALLQHARRHCRYYGEHLPADMTAWHAIPLLTRQNLQDHFDALLADRYPSAHGKTFDISTGGSTGEPVTVRRTTITQLFWQATTLRDHLWHRRDFSACMAIIRQFPKPVDETRPGHWGGVLRTGPAWHLPITCDIASQLRWLQKIQPQILLTYPANLEALILHMQHTSTGLPSLREIRTISGTVSPLLRKLCQTELKIPLTDLYSSQEVGIIALQCPDSGLLHVQSEHVLIEVLDPAGNPCREGEIGQVVVTDLHNFAMPLIRYALRDWAEVGPPCPCGRGLPTLRRVMGRIRNMAHSPDGKQFWPVLGLPRFREIIPNLRQFQVIQTAYHAMTMHLVCQSTPSAQQFHMLQLVLEEALGYSYHWSWQIRATELPLTASGKFEEFISQIDVN